ncbi:hypothetical protein AXG93_1587s1350 [Marchantia polymorpha subsp. ruderalis]|uniref:Chalcone/stilbene synthase N-terminal domain-containing protein n=1 Tax=Marchantia polymorpha subsp. ruderalis TaxID=1480154 RepID=A0A176WPZ7_MARPO|nr:hypothetical protein AXG93_1587s1350 [Marchantia polymorpha subsp. ruderalis]
MANNANAYKHQKAEGPATVLAIGKATAPRAFPQSFWASNVKHIMLYQQGCFGGATVLRVAKDLAENNKSAKVQAVVSELTSVTFNAPNEELLDNLVGSAIFGDGAAILVIGSDPVPEGGRAILDEVAKTLNLNSEKMEATKDVLYNYGNMSGANVLFVLDQMRRRSAGKKSSTTGEGCEWGLIVGFGPRLTIEV